jgi:GNAT superfamily N-acetyltransferase
MIDLLIAVRLAECITDSPSVVDLQELLSRSTIQANTRLWQDADGQLVGFAFVDAYNNLRLEIAPRASGDEIESQMVAWGVECVRRARREHGEPVTLDASCRGDDVERFTLLGRHGFAIQQLRSLRMIRPLDEPIPAPQLPEGFVIRHVAGEHKVEPLVALHRAAFGTEKRNEGYTDPVATHPAFQRRGLARALLLTGLCLLKQRGVNTVVLGTSSENVAMQQVANSVGFRVQSTMLWFEKQAPGI